MLSERGEAHRSEVEEHTPALALATPGTGGRPRGGKG